MFNKYINVYRGMPKQAWMLALVVLINHCGTMVLFFLTLYLTQNLHFSIQDAGKLVSIYGLGSLVGTYSGGQVCDRWGTFKVQAFSLIGAGICYLTMLTVQSFIGLALVIFITAVITDAFLPANISAIAQVCPPEHRAKGFALNRLAHSLGITIGPALGGLLAAHNYRLLFWVDGLTSLVAGIIFWRLFHRRPIIKATTGKPESGPVTSPWRDLRFLYFLALMFIMGIVFFQIYNTWSLYLKNYYHIPENHIGILLALNAVMIVIIEMPLVHYVERMNPLPIIALGMLLIGLGFGILPLGVGGLYVGFTVVVFTIGEMLAFPLTSAYIANLAQDSNRGKYMGLFSFTLSLAFVAGPVLGAWIYEHWGPVVLWSGVGILGIIMYAGVMYLHHTEMKRYPVISAEFFEKQMS